MINAQAIFRAKFGVRVVVDQLRSREVARIGIANWTFRAGGGAKALAAGRRPIDENPIAANGVPGTSHI
jgi:hypothetical protein